MTIANKNAFTLLELVIALAVLSVGVLGVLTVMQEWLSFVERTRQDIIASNLAKEWVEAVFALRNTNWRQWSWQKDECWLLQDTFAPWSTPCADSSWIWSGTYILDQNFFSGHMYFSLIPVVSQVLDASDGIASDEQEFALCYDEKWWFACPGSGAIGSQGRFYRQIVGKGLYRKDVTILGGELIDCPEGSHVLPSGSLCGDDRPKEFRFCVRVASSKQPASITEYCSVLTNFLE